MTLLLQGIVGSTAYGLAREGSDVDRLGIWAAESGEFFGLNPPVGKRATQVRTSPDLTLHEIGKFCSLALQCNPTILELLWLPKEFYETRTTHGNWLIEMRSAFLSRKRVRNAYFGYAQQQFVRLSNKQRFPDVPVNRIEKHARHMRRLLAQGAELYLTGTMSVRVSNPDDYFSFGEDVANGNLTRAEKTLEYYSMAFDYNDSISPLPDEPDSGLIESWLRQTRKDLM